MVVAMDLLRYLVTYANVHSGHDLKNVFDCDEKFRRDSDKCGGVQESNNLRYGASIIYAVDGWGAWFTAL